MSCHLTESERARYAMMSAMGIKIERCLAGRVPMCILPLGHGGPCVGAAPDVACDHDIGECHLRRKARLLFDWDITCSWCIW